MSIYVNVPQTINKFTKLYAETGRKRRITKTELSEKLNLGRSATDNYFYEAANYGAIETLSPQSFKISDDLIELLKYRDAYHRKIYQLVLSHRTFRDIIKKFRNKIPTHSKLIGFLLREIELKQSAATRTLQNYYKTAEWLQSQGLYNFDDYFGYIDELNAIDAVTSKEEAIEIIESIQNKIKDEKDGKKTKGKATDVAPSPKGEEKAKPSPREHALSVTERNYLDYLDRRIADLKEKIALYEANLPKLKNELYQLQKERYELLHKKK